MNEFYACCLNSVQTNYGFSHHKSRKNKLKDSPELVSAEGNIRQMGHIHIKEC